MRSFSTLLKQAVENSNRVRDRKKKFRPRKSSGAFGTSGVRAFLTAVSEAFLTAASEAFLTAASEAEVQAGRATTEGDADARHLLDAAAAAPPWWSRHQSRCP